MTIVGFGATRGVSWSAWQRHGGNFEGKKLARLAVEKFRHDIVDLKNTGGTGACFGDSGGPMFRVDGLQEYLVGVVFMISGSRCATEGGYSSVHLLAYSDDWFRAIVRE